MNNEELIFALRYAQAKQVPDMKRGFRIETRYGTLEIKEQDAIVSAAIVDYQLARKLHLLQEAQA